MLSTINFIGITAILGLWVYTSHLKYDIQQLKYKVEAEEFYKQDWARQHHVLNMKYEKLKSKIKRN